MHQIFDGLQVEGPLVVQGFRRDTRDLIYASQVMVDLRLASWLQLALVGATCQVQDPMGAEVGDEFTMVFTQDATGGRQVTWGSAYDWGSGGPPDMSGDAPFSRTVVRGHVVDQGKVVCQARRGKGASVGRAPYGASALVYYLRPGGNDGSDGLSLATAFATFGRLLSAMAGTHVNRPVGGNITGMTVSAKEMLNLGGDCHGGVLIDAFDFLSTFPYVRYRHSRFLWADPQLVLAVTVTGQSLDAKSGLLTLTVSDTLVVNAHKGQFVGTTTPGEYAEIRDNTASTIRVSWAGTLTTPVSVYQTGAELRFGNQSNSNEQAVHLLAQCCWCFTGIKVSSNGDAKSTAMTVWPNAPVMFQLCDLSGIQMHQGAGYVTIDGCHVRKTVAHDGASVQLFDSGFEGASFLCHGSGASGVNEWFGWTADGCSAIGGGNPESHYTFQFGNFEVAGGTGHGVEAAFGSSTMSDGVIKDCAQSAVHVSPLANLGMTNISGKGTTARYGIEVPSGPSRVHPVNCDVSGALNDILHGATAAAYAAVPLTDATALVRIE